MDVWKDDFCLELGMRLRGLCSLWGNSVKHMPFLGQEPRRHYLSFCPIGVEANMYVKECPLSKHAYSKKLILQMQKHQAGVNTVVI